MAGAHKSGWEGEEEKPWCIVTGANSGIGSEITAGLMRRGAHVVMACRNMESCEAVRQRLMQAQQAQQQQQGEEENAAVAGSCECARLDLEDAASVRAFAAAQLAAMRQHRNGGSNHNDRRRVVLVNNAGVMGVGHSAADGGDRHWRANYLGPFLLTRLLLPAMAPRSRVVSVSSRAHYAGSLDGERSGELLASPTPQHWFGEYCRSKLAQVLFTAELQRRHGGGIVATSVSPGFVQSNIFSSVPWPFAPLCRAAAALVGRTPAQGAAVAVYAATSPELEEEGSGAVPLFLHDCKPREPAALARNATLARDLWAASSRMVGLPE